MPGSFSDHIMPDKIHILNVSFIMQTFRREFGGTAGNIAYSLALLKAPVLLVASAGNDFDDYKKHIKNFKLDMSGIKIFKNAQTAQGFVTTDKDDNQIWGFYEGAMRKARTISLAKFLKRGDFLIVAPNDSVAMIKFIKDSVKNNVPYLFDPAFNIPHFSKQDLGFAVKNAAIVVGNDYEIELIKRRLGMKSISRNNQILITTLGARGSVVKEGKKEWRIPPAKPQNTSDPTGAGDAYRAGFMAGFLKQLPLNICGKIGSLSAVYTVEKYGTQTHKFSLGEFKKRFKSNFKTEPNF
jgi:adenosine kinase